MTIRSIHSKAPEKDKFKGKIKDFLSLAGEYGKYSLSAEEHVAVANHIKKLEEELKKLKKNEFEEIDEDELAADIREALDEGHDKICLNRHEANVILTWYDALNG